jgi:hypothetical protein
MKRMTEDGEDGAGNETRTRDPDLGKVVLYQLSYSRIRGAKLSENCRVTPGEVKALRPTPVRLRI